MVMEIKYEEKTGLSSEGELYFDEGELVDFEAADPEELLDGIGEEE